MGYTTDTVPQRYMVDDQRFASYRPDVLVYETDPLEEDVTIAGPISPKLKISSSGTDSDFDVKLIDVYPDDYPDPADTSHGNKRILDAPPLHMGGYEELLRGEPFRAKFRNSWEKPEPLDAGQRDRHQLHHAGSVSHLPAWPSHHGSGAEFVVPVDRSQSADVYRHSLCHNRAISKGDRAGLPPEGCGFRGRGAGVAATLSAAHCDGALLVQRVGDFSVGGTRALLRSEKRKQEQYISRSAAG